MRAAIVGYEDLGLGWNRRIRLEEAIDSNLVRGKRLVVFEGDRRKLVDLQGLPDRFWGATRARESGASNATHLGQVIQGNGDLLVCRSGGGFFQGLLVVG
eukprot:CAMPEP_0185760562 /NCGR_PEP_ID=MMETSP1174-20130828/19462_1 /TAXON_ID=35687 /ORGANISM="Dictyocha speculum, Strain CCMP1381" /LENGTH=99 /DNA_ID=CAMNT_0028441437 /DNA_START=551 /DNA_END=847 /DNA_ORIENTATION=+